MTTPTLPHWPFGPLTPEQIKAHNAQVEAMKRGALLPWKG